VPSVGISRSTNPLVPEIARHLVTDGRYVRHLGPAEFGTGQLQAVVDIGWAARQAGQLLDRPVRVTTVRSEEHGGLVVTAEFADV